MTAKRRQEVLEEAEGSIDFFETQIQLIESVAKQNCLQSTMGQIEED